MIPSENTLTLTALVGDFIAQVMATLYVGIFKEQLRVSDPLMKPHAEAWGQFLAHPVYLFTGAIWRHHHLCVVSNRFWARLFFRVRKAASALVDALELRGSLPTSTRARDACGNPALYSLTSVDDPG